MTTTTTITDKTPATSTPGTATPTIAVRRSAERGRGEHGWLQSWHTFSFADYHDKAHMGFGPLRVINEDIVAPGRGFGMHPHRDMEIVTYMVSGELEHGDSLGNKGVIRPGEVQRISAGTGLLHSEMNPSKTTPAHLLQIWIMPSTRGEAPSYDQRSLRATPGRLSAIATPDGADGTVRIRQDATILAGVFPEGGAATHVIGEGRRVWVQMARGGATVNSVRLEQGDGAGITGAGGLALVFDAGAEALVFDLP